MWECFSFFLFFNRNTEMKNNWKKEGEEEKERRKEEEFEPEYLG